MNTAQSAQSTTANLAGPVESIKACLAGMTLFGIVAWGEAKEYLTVTDSKTRDTMFSVAVMDASCVLGFLMGLIGLLFLQPKTRMRLSPLTLLPFFLWACFIGFPQAYDDIARLVNRLVVYI